MIGGGILKSLRVPKALKFAWGPWRPVALSYKVPIYILSDEDFESKAVFFGRKATDEAFTIWPALGPPEMYFRERSVLRKFKHELRHATPKEQGGGQFHV